MEEILSSLKDRDYVLDLGCARGSFERRLTSAIVIRYDRDMKGIVTGECGVRGDASALPFRDGSFAAVIANHSLEHFESLDTSLKEVGRIIAPGAVLFVSVPDASTFTDRLYRWLAKGGGHVNPFTSADTLANAIETATSLRHVATRTLCSSLSFLNRRNSPTPRPRRLWLIGGGYEFSLFVYIMVSRFLDRVIQSRFSVYGWALYFGNITKPIDTRTLYNVCVRCGSSTGASILGEYHKSSLCGISIYHCPRCRARNPYVSRDV